MAEKAGYIGRSPSDSSTIVARQVFTPTSDTTTFTFSSGYTVGYLEVYLNGSKLINGSSNDFVANNGTTVVLNSAAVNGDVVEVVAYKAFNVATVDSASGNFTVGGNLTVDGTFSGDASDLTGIVTSITAGDNISVSGATGNVTITGLANTSNVVADSLVVQGISTFSGNVSIAGTLTYEDVTNIDSVGLITARSGIIVTGVSTFNSAISIGDTVSLGDDDRLRLGTGNDLELFHDGTHSYIRESGAGTLRVETSELGVLSADGSTTMAQFIENGRVALRFNNSEKLETTSGGINVTGVVTATSFSGDGSALTGIEVGITTTASSPSANTVVTLNLSTAQHHQLTLSAGITTITCSGGSFGDSHSVVVIQPSSGIATVGFSTYFLFPSGSAPAMSEGSGKTDLISFVVKTVGGTGFGTELLASAGLDYQ